jgi:hypothetical protein
MKTRTVLAARMTYFATASKVIKKIKSLTKYNLAQAILEEIERL